MVDHLLGIPSRVDRTHDRCGLAKLCEEQALRLTCVSAIEPGRIVRCTAVDTLARRERFTNA